MLQSPAKRRKVSPTRAIAADADNTEQGAVSNPTTPTRASYASPTKASLARSHPHILSRSPGRSSQAASRGKLLRQELLGRRPETNGSGQDRRTSASAPHTPRHRDDATHRTSSHTGPAPAPVESFSAALSRVFQGPELTKSAPRSPLTSRQPSAQNEIHQPRAGSIDDLPGFVMPKLVQRTSVLPAELSRGRSNELDLPPTPVQLGLNPAPERPRGLASSSSPRNSRDGSGKNRRRQRGSAVTSSPLKPKDSAPKPRSDTLPKDMQLIKQTQAEEAPESDVEGSEHEDVVPAMISEKRALRDDLQAQLSRLKAEMSKLETALNDSSAENPSHVNADVLALLITTNPACAKEPVEVNLDRSTSQANNPVHLGAKPLPYLTLFAPGNLHLSSKISSRTSNGRLLSLHTLTLTAPAPWPPQIFSAVFQVLTDPEEARVVSVNLKQPSKGSWAAAHHKSLFAWIYSRLDSPLHRFDIGSIVWGMGRYFDECVSRARALQELAGLYQKSKQHDLIIHEKTAQLTTEGVKSLIPYLAASQIEIDAPQANRKRKRDVPMRSGKGPGMLLSWRLHLDWTGEVHSKVDVVATGVSKKAQERVKELFGRLLDRKGIVGAMGNVRNLVTGEILAGE